MGGVAAPGGEVVGQGVRIERLGSKGAHGGSADHWLWPSAPAL